MLLFLGDIGGGELLLLALLLLVLLLALIWRLIRPTKPAVVVHQNTPSFSVAYELQKLEELRARGTLTQDEFNAQKARLLR
jgi:uncharacterized membrane protein